MREQTNMRSSNAAAASDFFEKKNIERPMQQQWHSLLDLEDATSFATYRFCHKNTIWYGFNATRQLQYG